MTRSEYLREKWREWKKAGLAPPTRENALEIIDRELNKGRSALDYSHDPRPWAVPLSQARKDTRQSRREAKAKKAV
jgi:hypothetical protein